MIIHQIKKQFQTCKNVLADIELLSKKHASHADFVSLAAVYEYKFDELIELIDQQLIDQLELDTNSNTDCKEILDNTVASKQTNSSIISTTINDDSDTVFEFSFGCYDGDWIFGIDSSNHESISISVNKLDSIISALHQLQSTQHQIV